MKIQFYSPYINIFYNGYSMVILIVSVMAVTNAVVNKRLRRTVNVFSLKSPNI